MHFLRPRMYDAIIPPPFDRHARKVTYASGAAELVGGLAVAAGRYPFARWWLITLLAAIWPANIWTAIRPELVPHVPRWALYARLPFQFVFVWHVWRGTEERRT